MFSAKCSLFVLSKIKTWTLRSLVKENPNIQKTLFDWPIVLQYDVKAKYQLISGKFSDMKVLISPERLLNQPKAIPVCIRSINHSNRSIYFRWMFCFVLVFSFQGHTKIALKNCKYIYRRCYSFQGATSRYLLISF